MYKTLTIICLCLILVSCGSKQAKQEDSGIEFRGDTLCISENSTLNQKVKLETIQKQNYSANYSTTGTVKAIPSQIAEIAPPFNGRIVRSFVQLGQTVKAGTPVFELSSSEFYDATKSYFQSLQNKKMTEQNLRRQRDLVQNGVGTQKDLEEAETNYEVARTDYENAASALRIFNVDPEHLTLGQNLKVTSPISGEVVQSNLVVGQYIKSDAAPLAIVANLNQVWVVAQVKEKYIGLLKPQDKVKITLESAPGKEIEGHIYHISDLLDEETRSVEVMVVCDNAQRSLKPGMFANVRFINTPQESLLIPSTALLQHESGSYVFVQLEKGKFQKRMVQSRTASQKESVVIEGLQSGEVIVSEGGIYLNK